MRKQFPLLRWTVGMLAVLFCFVVSVRAQVTSPERLDGWCENGGIRPVTAGSQSSNKVQGTVTSCVVSVYLAGSSTLAPLCSDRSSPTCTPLANPFTADALTGAWAFYTNPGRYKIVLSGGTSPNAFTTPFTRDNVVIAAPAASSTFNLTVRETDLSPSIPNVTTIQVSPGTLMDNGGGIVTVATGGGGGGGSGYNLIQNSGTPLTARTTLNIASPYFNASDDAPNSRTNIRPARTPTGVFNAVTDLNCAGDPTSFTGTISSGTSTLTISSASGWLVGQGILINNAGTAGPTGTDLVTTVLAISGTTFTLADPATSTATAQRVQHDNTSCLQTGVNLANSAPVTIHFPSGNYLFANGPITLPAVTEGRTFSIQGDSTTSSSLHFQGLGSFFIGNDLAMEAFDFRDLTIATSTPGSYSDVRPTVNRGSAFDFSKTDVANYPRWRNLRIIGWGRWGIFCQNCQGGSVQDSVFRQNAQGHIGWVAPETLQQSGAKEPNVNLVEGCQFDLMPNISNSDTALANLSMGTNSYVVTATVGTPFTSSHEGRLVRIIGGGIFGGDLIALIRTVDSSTQITISAKNQTGAPLAGLTGTIYKSNLESIYLHRAQHSAFVSNIIQGNASGSTLEIDGVRIENTFGATFRTHWSEDTGGSGGHDFRILNSYDIRIDDYHSNDDPTAATGDTHAGQIKATNSREIYVTGMEAPNPTKHFDLDTISTLVVDNSILSDPTNVVNTFVANRDHVVVGPNVRYFSDTNGAYAYRNTLPLYDVQWENRLTNGRFYDGSVGMTGWTDAQPTLHTLTRTGYGRYQTYDVVNSQAVADAGETTIFNQSVAIEDTIAAGTAFTLGYDWYVENFGTPASATRFVQVKIDASGAGTNAVGYTTGFLIRSDNPSSLALATWNRMPITVYVGSGTGRSFNIQIVATRGPSTPRVRIANLRFQQGRSSWFDHAETVTDLNGGNLRNGALLKFTETVGGGASDYVALQAPSSIATSYALKLPTADGTSGQALITNGSGQLSFSTVGGGGSTGNKVVLSPKSADAQDINFPAYTLNIGTNFPVVGLAYDAATEQTAYWTFRAKGYTGGNLTLKIIWYADTATSGDIIWGAAIAAITPNTDSQDVETKAFASAQTTTCTHLGTTAQRVQSCTITISNLDSIAADDQVWIKVYRDADAGGDTMTGLAFLIEAEVSYN